MHGPFRTALIAVSFAAAAVGICEAKPRTPTHLVVSGETLGQIAAREGLSVAELARVNQLEGGGGVAAGTVLALDEAASATVDSAPGTSVSPELRSELLAAEAGAPGPSANADLAMWSSPEGAGAAAALETGTRHPDAMRRLARGIVSRTSSIARSLTRDAMRFIGTPYVFGGTSTSGFDCSGYVQHVFGMLGIALPRTADAQFYAGHRTRGGIASGDLVFFQTYEPGPSHVGIYIGAGKFIHSCSHGVMISRLREHYWAARYLGAKRVVASR